jgi:beta-1,4-mannosyl-glycoprotein beta-1,4-N-acetylglucosaminyltransferase
MRPSRALSALCALLVLVGLWAFGPLVRRRDFYMSPETSQLYVKSAASDEPDVANSDASAKICSTIGMRSYHGPRKVYDLVMFSTELDWLEIRLHEHGSYVDYFVIIESATTFSGISKPFVLKENWNKFAAFHHKMIYREIHDPVQSTRPWDHEDYLRNAMLREVFPSITDEALQARRGDVLIVSDMDELLRPGTLIALKHCDFTARLTLRSQFYYYSFQWRHRGEQWAHPEATIFGKSVEQTIAPNDLRMNLLGPGWTIFAAYRRWRDHATLWDAGWHCSSCFRTIGEMQTKMQSFSHQGWNTADNRDARTMIDRVQHGIDLFGREGEIYDKVTAQEDAPQYILEQYKSHGRFGYLLDRDGPAAGFEDAEGIM